MLTITLNPNGLLPVLVPSTCVSLKCATRKQALLCWLQAANFAGANDSLGPPLQHSLELAAVHQNLLGGE